MILNGTVRSTDERFAEVELESAPCESCRTPCAACGQNRAPRFAKVENTIGAKAGDAVKLECRDKSVLVSSVLLFLFPLLAGIVTAVLCLPYGQITAALSGLFALAVCFALAALILSRDRQKQKAKLTLIDPKSSANSGQDFT